MIPITILTGFLGSGKTTLLNQIITQNPQIKFGLIINEFGEVGIDGQLVENSGEEMVEMSNGCLCCVVRKDLQDAVGKLLDKGVDYVLIETSGLAEPRPIAETFAMNDLGGRVRLDSVICVLDAENYAVSSQNYQIALEQLQFSDVLVLNKVSPENMDKAREIQKLIPTANPQAVILINDGKIANLLIDLGKWDTEKLEKLSKTEEKKEQKEIDHAHKEEKHEHENKHGKHNHDDEDCQDENCGHHHEHGHKHHHHEHEEVQEIVFKTEKVLDPNKLDNWLQNQFPSQIVRAKGILQLQTPKGNNFYLFQMVGANRILEPFIPKNKKVDLSFSRLVLIGRDLPEAEILENLGKCVVQDLTF